MVNHRIYQKTNLLNDEDFDNLVKYRDYRNDNNHGAIFREDGSMTLLTDLTEDDEDFSFKKTKTTVISHNFSIDDLTKGMGEPFRPTFIQTQKAMLELGLKNPQPFESRFLRLNVITEWHKHLPLKKYKQFNQFNTWVSTMYMHPKWDTKHGGALRVGLIPEEIIATCQCYSNSVIFHPVFYGHDVAPIYSGYEGDRDVLVTHWVEYSQNELTNI